MQERVTWKRNGLSLVDLAVSGVPELFSGDHTCSSSVQIAVKVDTHPPMCLTLSHKLRLGLLFLQLSLETDDFFALFDSQGRAQMFEDDVLVDKFDLVRQQHVRLHVGLLLPRSLQEV